MALLCAPYAKAKSPVICHAGCHGPRLLLLMPTFNSSASLLSKYFRRLTEKRLGDFLREKSPIYGKKKKIVLRPKKKNISGKEKKKREREIEIAKKWYFRCLAAFQSDQE